jgi:hypothetical protein
MSYESHKYYNENLYASNAKDVKNQQLLWNLYASIAMVVKNQQLLWDLYVGIVVVVRKTSIYYETYMQVLHIWNDLMEIVIEWI